MTLQLWRAVWQPQNVEAGLQCLSLLRLGSALLGPGLRGQQGPGAPLHVACMALLALLASVLDRARPIWFSDHSRYTFRKCGQAGLAQGLLALPSLATAIAIATRSWWWNQLARLLVASSFQALLWLAWTAAYGAERSGPGSHALAAVGGSSGHGSRAVTQSGVATAVPAASSGAVGQAPPAEPGAGARRAPAAAHLFGRGGASATRLFLWAVAAGSLLSAVCALLHGARPPPASSPHLLLPGTVFALPYDITASAWALQAALLLASAPALDRVAAAMPRCFTPGEAAIALQAALALAAGAAAYLAGGVRQGLAHVLWSPHVVQPDPGMHVPAFSMLVLFWALTLAGCATLVARGGRVRCAPSRAAAPRQRATPAAAGPPGSARGGGVGNGAHAATAGGLTRRKPPLLPPGGASAAPGGVDGAGTHVGEAAALSPEPDVDVLLARAVRAGAVVGAAVSSAALLDLALWVLGRFVAASSRPRLATLAYWFGCLAVAVPVMYGVSKASAAGEEERRQEGKGGGQAEGEAEAEGQAEEREHVREQGCSQEEEEEEEREQGGKGACGVQEQVRGARDVGGQRAGEGLVAGLRGEGDGAGWLPAQPNGLGGGCVAPHPGCTEPRCCGRGAGPDAADGAAQPGGEAGGRGAPASATASGSVGPAPCGARPQRVPRGRPPAGWLLRAPAVPHIVMRKGYHLLAILLFLPAYGWDARMLAASLAVAGAVLVGLEQLRCLGPAPLRRAIGGFMADFSDARDSGPVYVTHFTLLLGIAVPVWLADPVCGAAAGAMMAGLYGPEAAEPMAGRGGQGEAAEGAVRLSAAAARLLPSCHAVLGLGGLVSLGCGDTAAACVGFLLGRRRLFRGGRKTWEGTASGAAAMLGSWAVVVWWMDVRWALGWGAWGALAAITCGAALLEAVTLQLDNVVVPLYYTTHLALALTGN
ncbi:Dolichol kinase [Tetrabaena socialis]|uniref:dolichol kinase n=1 Tax=Tetrabaena socialis TaxID=47790 RepID=A0A2J8A714_9CHLO|nr:Dolichol kinase [Tetrabaena socialis]|eukprot:PNH08314.1 Dolichol kinase [Tetrabaena socialis]